MSDDDTVQGITAAEVALAMARSATETSDTALAKAEEALSGLRSCYQALGQLRDLMRQIEATVSEIQARLGRFLLESSRPAPPDDPNGDA